MKRLLGLVFLPTVLGAFFLPPPDTPKPVVVVCSSYNSLCGLQYRYINDDGEPLPFLSDRSSICRCVHGVECNTDWNNSTNALVEKLLTGSGIFTFIIGMVLFPNTQDFAKKRASTGGLQLEAMISFCSLPTNRKPCRLNDPVLVTKGQGQFSFQLDTPPVCDCRRPLVVKASWQDGAYNYIQYGCGQPRCQKIQSDACAEVKYAGRDSYSYEYLCRCRRDELCIGQLPTAGAPIADHTCYKQTHKRK